MWMYVHLYLFLFFIYVFMYLYDKNIRSCYNIWYPYHNIIFFYDDIKYKHYIVYNNYTYYETADRQRDRTERQRVRYRRFSIVGQLT